MLFGLGFYGAALLKIAQDIFVLLANLFYLFGLGFFSYALSTLFITLWRSFFI